MHTTTEKTHYLFVTFTSRTLLPPVAGRGPQHQRGTQILVAESLAGPFQPFHNRPHTPPDWMALDGTLWVEDGVPWMIFRDLSGRLMLALHQPNSGNRERARFFPLVERDGMLSLE